MARTASWLILIAVSSGALSARAQSQAPVSPPTAGNSSAASNEGGAPSKSRAKGRRVREKKEAEGTQALNRFEADTIHKSKYQLNGEQLEVDPD